MTLNVHERKDKLFSRFEFSKWQIKNKEEGNPPRPP